MLYSYLIHTVYEYIFIYLFYISFIHLSFSDSGAVEAQACLFLQVDDVVSQQRELDGSVREILPLLQGNSNQVSSVQRELKDVYEKDRNLCFDQEAVGDVRQLKEQWRTLQVTYDNNC